MKIQSIINKINSARFGYIIDGQRIIFKRIRKRKKSHKRSGEYIKYKEKARSLIKEKIDFYINRYKEIHDIDFNYSGKIAIRNTKSRWGSCSSKGNLNFSYKLYLIPIELAEYIIVHELCHLKEFNHGKGFWDLVELEVPNYSRHRLDLRKYSLRR